MIITSLADNECCQECCPEHGLSLHVRLDCGKEILFDMGQGSLFADNAERLGIDLSRVDMAVVSHGHYDHGGGLETFLELNDKAEVYVREAAFGRHSSIKEYGLKDIGITLPDTERMVFCKDLEQLPFGAVLFSNPERVFPEPDGNRLLLGPDGKADDFSHEQNMIIREGSNAVLFGGCAHRGIVNIVSKAQQITGNAITHVLSGTHIGKGSLDDSYTDLVAEKLLALDGIRYYTMHCTGADGFRKLKDRMSDRISYLRCGESLKI